MRVHKLLFLALPFLALFYGWGFFAHKHINQHAVFTLPANLSVFYKKHIHLITEKAIDPDKRCYVDSLESPRHFIDVDRYSDGQIDSIPIHWSAAQEKYQERQLMARGIVPWQIHFTYQKLVKAFIGKDVQAIIRHSADLGHYIADAHVPLHTSSNYNGQFTGQLGIHAFWESRIPEMFAQRYNLVVGKATYIANSLDSAWMIVKESNALVEDVLAIEKKLSQEFPADRQRSFVNRNNILVATYSDDYTRSYHQRMNGMVEQRMRMSVRRIGSFWFSAWVDAGQPTLDLSDLTPSTEKEEKAADKIIGREEWH